MIPTRLHAPLHIPDRLQQTPGLLQVLRENVLLLGHLAHQHPKLVADIRHCVVTGFLAPLGELGGNGGAFPAGGFVRSDGMGLGFDELEDLLAQVGLGSST